QSRLLNQGEHLRRPDFRVAAPPARRRREPASLDSTNEPIILGVRANPDPQHTVVPKVAEHPIVRAHADRIQGTVRGNALEVETGMIRMLAEQPVGSFSLALYVNRQCGEQVAEGLGGSRSHWGAGGHSSVRPASSSASAFSISQSS